MYCFFNKGEKNGRYCQVLNGYLGPYRRGCGAHHHRRPCAENLRANYLIKEKRMDEIDWAELVSMLFAAAVAAGILVISAVGSVKTLGLID